MKTQMHIASILFPFLLLFSATVFADVVTDGTVGPAQSIAGVVWGYSPSPAIFSGKTGNAKIGESPLKEYLNLKEYFKDSHGNWPENVV